MIDEKKNIAKIKNEVEHKEYGGEILK